MKITQEREFAQWFSQTKADLRINSRAPAACLISIKLQALFEFWVEDSESHMGLWLDPATQLGHPWSLMAVRVTVDESLRDAEIVFLDKAGQKIQIASIPTDLIG